MVRFPWRLTTVGAVILAVLIGCSGGDGDGGVAPQPGTIGIGVSPASLTLVQGQTGTVAVALTRGGSFTGGVTLSAQGAPSGVTVAGGTIAAGSSSAQLNVTASASAAVGTASVTITASGTGVTSSSATLSVTIQISAENGYDPSISVSSLNLTQGASESTTISVNRASGFAGAVTFSASAVPSGLAVAFDPAVVTGDQTTMTVDVDPALAPGNYSFSVDAEADDPGGSASAAAASAAMVTKSFTVSVLVVASGGGGTPEFFLSLGSADLTVPQAGSGSVTLDVTRSGGFTGGVDLSFSGQPSGMTVSASSNPVTGDQTAIIVSVDGSVPPGDYTITIDGSGTGAPDRSVELIVTVVSPDGFTMALGTSSLTIPQGSNGSTQLTITRAGSFTGPVQLSTSGAPSGMSVVPSPVSVSGTVADLAVDVGSGVTPGSYPITITGMGTGVPDQTASLNVNVTASGGGGGGNVSVTFCEAFGLPVWVGGKDGNGDFTQLFPTSGNTYNFDVSSVGALAWVEDRDGDITAVHWYGTADYLNGIGGHLCDGPGTVIDVSGTVAGVGAQQQATISLGGSSATIGLGQSNDFIIEGARNAPGLTLIGTRSNITQTGFATDAVVFRRGVDPSSGTVGEVNFNTSAFAPITNTINIDNLGADQASVSTLYITNTFDAADLQSGFGGGAVQSALTIPSQHRAAGEFHLFGAVALPTGGSVFETRTVQTYRLNPGASETLTLGPPLNPASFSSTQTSPEVLFNVQHQTQPEYDKQFTFSGSQFLGTQGRTFIAIIQSDYLGSGDVDFTMGDLNSAGGYNAAAWGMVPGEETTLTFGASSWNFAGTEEAPIADGSTLTSAAFAEKLIP